MGVDDTRHSAYSFIRSNINYLVHLPPPDQGTWVAREEDIGVQKKLRACLRHGVIVQGEIVNPSYQRYNYRTNPVAYRDVQDVLERRDTLPCGHTGVSNLPGGGYGCGFEWCDREFGRGVVEEAFGWE